MTGPGARSWYKSRSRYSRERKAGRIVAGKGEELSAARRKRYPSWSPRGR